MITERLVTVCAWLGLGGVLLAAPPIASADTITYNLNTKFDLDNPGPSVSGATAVFTDVGTDQVELTLSFANSDTGLKAFGWYFNFTGDVSALAIVPDSGPTVISMGTQSNAFKADGDGFFDVLLAFGSGGSQVFNAGDVATFTLSGTSLNAHSFNDHSAPGGGNGAWKTAVHIGGFTTPTNYSVWQGDEDPTFETVVPLPPAVWAGLMLMGVTGAARFRYGSRSRSA